ncbi:MAG: transcriptional regulator [Micrococcus sp.]|nr:transcriptional regulator [Micrococcus sp.]
MHESHDPAVDPSELSDPVRRLLYGHIGKHPGATRDEAARAAGISRTLAAYHLDRLAGAGLLLVDYARPPGRKGPGAGRPAKRYWPAQEEVAVSIPPRDYGLMARLFVEAVDADGSPAIRTLLTTMAEEDGRAAGAEHSDLMTALRSRGYEPALTDDGDMQMLNCPFHRLAERHRTLVCGVNHALLRGVLAGRGDNPDNAELTPHSGRCCVVIHPSTPDARTDRRRVRPSVPGDDL